jgi:KDO2-lipid IV(A) lauroyltransferase
MNSRRKKTGRTLWKKLRPLRHRFVYVMTRVLSHAVCLLGISRARRFCAWLALFGMKMFPSERQKILNNLEMAYTKELSETQRKQLFRAIIRNLGMMAAEAAFISTGKADKVMKNIRIEGIEAFDQIPDGEGLVFITAHYGLWEMMPRTLIPHLKHPCAVVARELHNPYFEKVLLRTRKESGIQQVMTRGKSGREYIRFLREGGYLAVLGDIDTKRGDGLFVEFYERPAWTQRGIARLIKMGRAHAMVGFIERDLDDPACHTVRVGPLIEQPQTDDPREWEARVSQAYTNAIEEAVRRRPDQWMWMHRRWRTEPENPEAWKEEWEAKGLFAQADRPQPDPRIFRNH